jgi:epoxyqueuosine reductase
MESQETFRARLIDLGFDVVRFTRVESVHPQLGDRFKQWLAQGMQADMGWMGRTGEKRLDPQLVLAGARSVIVLGINYWPARKESSGPRWARYACYEDYHDTLKPGLVKAGKILEEMYGLTSAQYRYYVDAGPVLERGWAERSGVGFIGKNAMMISRDFGNWLFLAEIFTPLDFTSDPILGEAEGVERPEKSRVGLNCGNCTQCLDACPTGAIVAPGVVDARLCISYQTIENKGIIPRALRPGIGAHIYGCDVCLEVCPWNRFAQNSRQILLSSRFDLADLTLRELLSMTSERFAEVFRKTPIKRTKWSGLLRNACIVAANTGAIDCLDLLEALAEHAAPVVRAHAVWAVFRLAGTSAHQRLQAARSRESDPVVLAEYAAEIGVAKNQAS